MKLKTIVIAIGLLLTLCAGPIAVAQEKHEKGEKGESKTVTSKKHSAAWYRSHRKGTKHSAAWYRSHRKTTKHSAAWYKTHGKSTKHSAAWYKKHPKAKPD